MNDTMLAGLIGVTIGVLAMVVVCVIYATPNTALRGAGIERIAYCCNVHSNWYEIVWKEGKK